MNNDRSWYNPDQEIASIKWCMLDLEILFEEKGIKFTEENVNKVMDHRLTKTLEEQSVENGWEILSVVFDDCIEDLK